MFVGLSELLGRGSLSRLFVRLGQALAILGRGICPKPVSVGNPQERGEWGGESACVTPEFVRLFDGRRQRMLINTH
jgi:hypothetical protein